MWESLSRDVDPTVDGGTRTGWAWGESRARALSVLLAEHEPEVAEMSARYLRRDGLRVRLVTTPEQALAELTGGPDAAAVLDLTMPGLDPRRIRRALRTPVIFLVAGSGPGPRPGPQRRDDRPAAVAGPAVRPPPAGRHGPRRAGRAGRRRRPRARNDRRTGAGGVWLDGRTGAGLRWRAAGR